MHIAFVFPIYTKRKTHSRLIISMMLNLKLLKHRCTSNKNFQSIFLLNYYPFQSCWFLWIPNTCQKRKHHIIYIHVWHVQFTFYFHVSAKAHSINATIIQLEVLIAHGVLWNGCSFALYILNQLPFWTQMVIRVHNLCIMMSVLM